jgi:hypothetical protein
MAGVGSDAGQQHYEKEIRQPQIGEADASPDRAGIHLD